VHLVGPSDVYVSRYTFQRSEVQQKARNLELTAFFYFADRAS